MANQASGNVLAVRPFSLSSWRKTESSWKMLDRYVRQAWLGEGRGGNAAFCECVRCGAATGASQPTMQRQQ